MTAVVPQRPHGTTAFPANLRVLAQCWLSEVRPTDEATLASLPALAEHFPTTPAAFTDLAIEYQRLFGFNVPPYESVFVDPSAMLDAPATARVAALYARAGWVPPPDARVGAVDHLGLELLALADLLEQGPPPAAEWLVTRHLALWLPPLVLALESLRPHPFYAAVARLSQELVLSLLPDDALPVDVDPFPDLPAPPVYRASDEPASPVETAVPDSADPDDLSLRRLVRHLLAPRTSGLYLTKAVLVNLGRAAELPVGGGERAHMLAGLLRTAGQYDALPQVAAGLLAEIERWAAGHSATATAWPAWQPYASSWTLRLRRTQDLLAEMALQGADLPDA